MTDVVDTAQASEEFHLKLALDKAKPSNQVLSDGYCVDCDIEIPAKRLKIDPYVECCVDCQELREIKQKQLGG